jgi:hypothetical protein
MLGPVATRAQDADLPLQDEYLHFVNRIDILGLTGQALPTEIKPLPREQVNEWLGWVDPSLLGRRDRRAYQALQFWVCDTCRQTPREGGPLQSWRWLVPNGRDVLGYTGTQFRIYANPILGVAGGTERVSPQGGTAQSELLYINARGGHLRATLGKKLGIYTEVTDNQARYPHFIGQVFDSTRALVGESFVKPFGQGGFDFFNVRGYLTYSPVKPLRIKFGRDRAFWGQGWQSLTLSDHATDYLQLSFNLQLGKFQYFTQFAEFIDFIPNKPDAYGTFPRSYGAFHQLTFRPHRSVSLSFFESTIYATELANGRRGFELQYLNPVILYRSVEQAIGSPDNSLLGFQGKFNILRRVQLYGQMVVDDYNFGQRQNGSGWYGNKVGTQTGLHWLNAFGIETLDLQTEYNRVRPYTYSHFNPSSAYIHYGQPLAHPNGANLQEVVSLLRWQALPGLYVRVRYGWMQQGRDTSIYNYGADPRRSDQVVRTARPNSDFDNVVGQGFGYTQHRVQARISWQPTFWNLWLDLQGEYRLDNFGQQISLLAALRWNWHWREWR